MLVGPCGGGKTAIYHRVRAHPTGCMGIDMLACFFWGAGSTMPAHINGRWTLIYNLDTTALVWSAARDGHVDGGVGGAGRVAARARGAVSKQASKHHTPYAFDGIIGRSIPNHTTPLHPPPFATQPPPPPQTQSAVPFRLVDSPGHPRLRGLWASRLRSRGVSGVVLVVDAADFGSAGVREAAE